MISMEEEKEKELYKQKKYTKILKKEKLYF